MAVLTALGIAAGVAGTIGGAALSAHGASEQAQAAERASAQAVAEQRRQFDITQRNLQPWLTAGTQAIQTLQYLLGLGVPPGQAAQITSQVTGVPERAITNRLEQLQQMGGGFRDNGRPWAFDMEQDGQGVWEPSTVQPTARPAGIVPAGQSAGDFGSLMKDFGTADFEADPGYAFRLQEGFKALERSAAARGTVLSGGTLKELARYNQGFASNEFTNAYNRFQQNRATRFNQLASIAGLGQTTAAQLGQFGAQNASTIGNLIVGGQTAAAAARASGYNAWSNAIQNAANVPLNWMLLNQMSQRASSGQSAGTGGWV